MGRPSDLVQGALDLLLLKILALEPHGWAIGQRLKQISGDVLQVSDGSLYPALYRLEAKGWIAGSWALSEKGKRARYYRITPVGRRQLTNEHSKWNTFARAMGLLLKPLGEEGR